MANDQSKKGFAKNPELASEAGKKGGKIAMEADVIHNANDATFMGKHGRFTDSLTI